MQIHVFLLMREQQHLNQYVHIKDFKVPLKSILVFHGGFLSLSAMDIGTILYLKTFWRFSLISFLDMINDDSYLGETSSSSN